jgi:hypothetical protein
MKELMENSERHHLHRRVAHLGAGSVEGSLDAANILKPPLSGNPVRVPTTR